MIIDKYWSELMQVLTEDENLRIRKNDMIELNKTDIVEFMRNLKLFETRTEAMLERAKAQNK